MIIVNRDAAHEGIHSLTLKSSISGLHPLDYILHTMNLRSFDVSANYELDLGSDYRNISASLEFVRLQGSWKKRQISFKGWKWTLNDFQKTHEYHEHLYQMIDDSLPSSLHEFGQVVIRAAKVWGTSFQRPKGTKRPYQSKQLQYMIFQQREAQDDCCQW